jgi:RHH-type rel operon transcriptional repressor/antitoxin RelB
MSAGISIRLPDELMRELKVVADATERSKTYIIRKAIESYLQEYVDYLIALERLRDKEAEIISSKEMREQLAL